MICIKEYRDDVRAASLAICELIVDDLGDKKMAWRYAETTSAWEDVAEAIAGDPDQDHCTAEFYHAIADSAKEFFKVDLLGTY